MKRFICNQNAGLPSDWIIPGGGAGHNWHIQEWFNGLVMCVHINTPGGALDDGKIVTKAACICIRIGFIC